MINGQIRDKEVRVLSAARHAKTETERRVAVDSIMNVISMEVSEKDSTLTGIVDAYYAGNEFWLSVYRWRACRLYGC